MFQGFGPPSFVRGGSSASSTTQRKVDIHKQLFKKRRDDGVDDSDDDEEMREVDLGINIMDDQDYQNYTNSSGEEEFDDSDGDDYLPRGRGSFITLDGDDDDDDDYDVERGTSFSYSSTNRNRSVMKRFNSKPAKKSKRGKRNTIDETKMLKERPEKVECTLTAFLLVIILMFLLISGFISIYRTETVISKDDKGLPIHKEVATQQKDTVHSHGHILRGKHQQGNSKKTVKSKHHSIISKHVNSKNHTSYFEQMDSILPVMPYDEFLFQNTPISNYRIYSKEKISVHKFNNNHLGKDTPLVSVITTFSNEDSFKNTRDSILRQTFRYFEWIIIVNQGEPHDKILRWLSINPTVEKETPIDIGKMYKTNKISLIFSNEKQSQGMLKIVACKYLAKESRYLTFVESGGMIEPSLLEKLFLFLEFQTLSTSTPITMVNTMTLEFDKMKFFNLYRVQESAQMLTQKNLFHSTFMIEKQVFEKLGGFNSNPMEYSLVIWDFWVKYIQKGYRSWTIPEVLLWHNIQGKEKDSDRVTTEKSEEKKFISTHLKKRYKTMFEEKAAKELQSRGYLTTKVKIPNSKTILRRLAHDRHKFHKGKDRSIILVSENLNDPRRREFIVKLMESFIFEYDWHVVVITTDTEESNHAYRAELERYSTDIFHLNHFVDKTLPPDEHVLSLLIQYVISTRHIHNIFIMESILGYKSLSLLPPQLMEFTRVLDYIYTSNTNKYITESVKHNDLVYKTFLSSPDLTQLSSLIEIKSEKTSVLYPSLVNLAEFRVKPSDKKLDYLVNVNEEDFTLIGSKDILNFDENSKDLIISYWISDEDKSRCDSDVFKIIKYILESEHLERVKFLLLTDKKLSYNLDIFPEDRNEKESKTHNTIKLFSMIEELTSKHPDRILFVKPGKKASSRTLKKYLRLFSPYSHVNLFSDSCGVQSTSQVSIPPIVFQSMATQNAIIALHHQPDTTLENFINKFKIGISVGLYKPDDEHTIIETLQKWLKDLESFNTIRTANIELIYNLFNVHSVSNMIHSQAMH
ncbi:predicted protein [Naegleria gruberi]|uniref:Predicted protein n=1 Tax=Naegleria gruberi TaxID=5762 RepID=D2VZQ5_NAEGR|nr:uncharacterized protein NAEGRDRAFT_53565 [Naegleria gruberi]EFC37739.1 predicted protein [Naegleria gruberi]|eukprot:XP_002670483.1 predicted protein [Naegleria gruberi strain NEG-M]